MGTVLIGSLLVVDGGRGAEVGPEADCIPRVQVRELEDSEIVGDRAELDVAGTCEGVWDAKVGTVLDVGEAAPEPPLRSVESIIVVGGCVGSDKRFIELSVAVAGAIML